MRSHGRNWDLSRALLMGHGPDVAPVLREDAERATRLWRVQGRIRQIR